MSPGSGSRSWSGRGLMSAAEPAPTGTPLAAAAEVEAAGALIVGPGDAPVVRLGWPGLRDISWHPCAASAQLRHGPKHSKALSLVASPVCASGVRPRGVVLVRY